MIPWPPATPTAPWSSRTAASWKGPEMLNVTFKSLWARKRRLAGTFVAVLLGVAFLSGTLVLGDTLRANFDRLFTTVTRGTSAQARSATKIGGGHTGSERGTIDRSLVAPGP